MSDISQPPSVRNPEHTYAPSPEQVAALESSRRRQSVLIRQLQGRVAGLPPKGRFVGPLGINSGSIPVGGSIGDAITHNLGHTDYTVLGSTVEAASAVIVAAVTKAANTVTVSFHNLGSAAGTARYEFYLLVIDP